MPPFHAYDAQQISELQRDVATAIKGSDTLQGAAQAWTSLIFQKLGTATALVRTYVTSPYTSTPVAYQRFASRIAEVKGAGGLLLPQTPVLCLLGSAGVEPVWNDVYQSKSHLAIPLIDATFVDQIPMVALILNDIGIGLDWFDSGRSDLVVQALGTINGLFYVPDAITDTDYKHRIVVPDQEFVEKYGIRTVFGIGGSYVSGALVTLIFFTREAVPKETAERFQPLIDTIRSETTGLAVADRIFAI